MEKEGREDEKAVPKRAAVRNAEKDRVSTCSFADRIARASIAEYELRRGDVEYDQTVLAAFLLHSAEDNSIAVVSMGVGTKVLSHDLLKEDAMGLRVRDWCVRFSPCSCSCSCSCSSCLLSLPRPPLCPGIPTEQDVKLFKSLQHRLTYSAISHAEVLARRSLLRVLYADLHRILVRGEAKGLVLERGAEPSRCCLISGKTLHLYTSSQPCGNATLKRWAKGSKERFDESLQGWVSQKHQRMQVHARGEGQVALLVKCSRPAATPASTAGATCDREGTIAPGTCEPGSGGGDAMSCSDKIAKWSCIGIQVRLVFNPTLARPWMRCSPSVCVF